MGDISMIGDEVIEATLAPDAARSVAEVDLSLEPNPALGSGEPGVFGLNGPHGFYLTLAPAPGMVGRATALGRIVAGESSLAGLSEGDRVLSVRILRSGESASAFATDEAAFQLSPDEGR